MGRLLAALVLAGLLAAGCTAVLLRTRATAIDEYTAVTVRVYRLGPRTCRVEVLTARDTIQTGPAVCDVIPHRTTP